MSAGTIHADPLDARRAQVAPGVLRAFNDAGVLDAADVHVARRLAALGGEEDELVLLAAALAARAPRLGHVCVDLAGVRATAAVDRDETVDLDALPWPQDIEEWAMRVAASPLVSAEPQPPLAAPGTQALDGAAPTAPRPLRLEGALLYLDRYWAQERDVAAEILRRSDAPAGEVDETVLADGLRRLFPGQTTGRQALAAATAVLRRFAVVAGGPGTGKTTTVARIVALLGEQAAANHGRPPLVALAAPTGKAAARLQEAVHAEVATLDVPDELRTRLQGLESSTLHRLLGWRPGSHSRFRHHRANRLPHEVVIVDETSMVSLPMMARLLEAVRPESRLVLIGDPGQLTSIEAGAVLGDVVGPAADGLTMRPEARTRLTAVTGAPVEGAEPPTATSVGDGIVTLDRVHRYGGAIARVAQAIRRGDPDATLEALTTGGEEVTWIAEDPATADADTLAPVRTDAVAAARTVVEAARAGDAATALAALGSFRVLCAHRRGDHGVATWADRITSWLTGGIAGFAAEGDWYPGRPLLVTGNDYGLRLYNGDTGVVVADPDGHPTAAFDRGGATVTIRPSRLAAVETVHAMTIHKSQGSQFHTAAVLLPDPGSRILTRELLYTAVTRAQERLLLTGSEDALRTAVEHPVARASGLRARVWSEP